MGYLLRTKVKRGKGMIGKEPRTIKISGGAYKALSDQSKEEKRPMEEIATRTILATLRSTSNNSHGEVYDTKTGKRIFVR